jgi:predicted dienelactone hydrolase
LLAASRIRLLSRLSATPRADGICESPPEFPDPLEQYHRLTKTDPDFQQALAYASDSSRDARVRAVFAMAPALGPAFTAASLDKISIPVEIAAGANDQNVPIESSAKYFAAHIPGAKLVILPGGVGHYVFMDTCTDQARKSLPILCVDTPGVDGIAIHDKVSNLALGFFAENLK